MYEQNQNFVREVFIYIKYFPTVYKTKDNINVVLSLDFAMNYNVIFLCLIIFILCETSNYS